MRACRENPARFVERRPRSKCWPGRGRFLYATEYYESSRGLLSEAIEQFEQAQKIKTDDPYAPSFREGPPGTEGALHMRLQPAQEMIGPAGRKNAVG